MDNNNKYNSPDQGAAKISEAAELMADTQLKDWVSTIVDGSREAAKAADQVAQGTHKISAEHLGAEEGHHRHMRKQSPATPRPHTDGQVWDVPLPMDMLMACLAEEFEPILQKFKIEHERLSKRNSKPSYYKMKVIEGLSGPSGSDTDHGIREYLGLCLAALADGIASESNSDFGLCSRRQLCAV